MDHAGRIAALQTALANRDVDAAVVYPGPNSYYLGGFFGEPNDRHVLLVVPEEGRPWFCTPEKSVEQVRADSAVDNCVIIADNDPTALSRRVIEEFERGSAVLVGDRTPFAVAQPFFDAELEIDAAAPVLADLRVRKDGEEVRALERAASLADEASEAIRSLGDAVIGMTEAEVANRIRAELHERGGSRLSFPVVVAAGENGARPYYRHGDRVIEAGDPVVLDFGAFLDGYASDQTRTVVFAGDPPDGFAGAYDATRAAFEAGVDAVEPGRTAGEIDREVRSVVTEQGFADRLKHATGHGVGVEAHEAPAITAENDRVLEPGMVFSIEPGVYLDGRFGVRIEDLVVVTETGCRRLNDSPKTWRSL